MTFRLALKQVRHERSLDRRLQWYEQLLEAIESHGAALKQLVAYEEAAEHHNLPLAKEALRTARFAVSESSQIILDVLSGARLYASAGVVRFALELKVSQLIVSNRIHGDDSAPESRMRRAEEIAKHVELLTEHAKNISGEVRKELGLDALTALPPSPFSRPRDT